MNRWEALSALTALPGLTTIQAGTLQPTDVIVIEADGPISIETREQIKAYMQIIWPDQKCIVLGDGLKLKVIRGYK